MQVIQGNRILNAIRTYIEHLRDRNISEIKLKAKEKAMEQLFSYRLNINLINAYISDIRNGLEKSNICFIEIKFKTLSKFISGWGPIYFITEVPMSWNLILDVPYISGSTIKGIIRDYFMELTGDNKQASCIFGDNNGVGKVVFFDAYPTNGEKILTYDIINPHYKGVNNEYDVMPVPIKFLAINEGVEFTTFLAFDKKELEECYNDTLSSLLRSIIFSTKMGWGRRTSKGYGDLEIVSKEVELKCPSS
jgi:CRISPR-associated protein Cmr6